MEERGGELKREVRGAPERWGAGAEGSLSEGEELQRLRDERRRVRRVSSRSRRVTIWWGLGGPVPGDGRGLDDPPAGLLACG